MLGCNHSFEQMCLLIGTVSMVSDVAHGPLVLLVKSAIALPGEVAMRISAFATCWFFLFLH